MAVSGQWIWYWHFERKPALCIELFSLPKPWVQYILPLVFRMKRKHTKDYIRNLILTLLVIVYRLFEEAANNLNMTALSAFLASLCESSKHQLHKITKTILEEEDFPGEHHNLPVNSLHLYRLQNVLMKVAHSDRPLIHLIKAWSVVSSYLVEVSAHDCLWIDLNIVLMWCILWMELGITVNAM